MTARFRKNFINLIQIENNDDYTHNNSKNNFKAPD